MSPQGELLYSTYFGGSGVEEPGGLFIDDSLNIYITGFTNSRNFPVKSAFSDTYNGGNDEDFGGDAFVIKFNMADYLLIFSTYLGGANNELSCGITIDKENNVYVIGGTSSSDFPTKNGYDTIYGGNNDGFITKLSSTGKQIIYSSYFGGSNLDALSAVAVNDKNEAYFSGGSASSGLICSANVFYKNLMGEEDIVIGKVDASGSRLEYLSYFGGTKTDVGDRGVSKLHLNEDETIIIVGNTLSTDFPVTGNAFQKEYGGPGEWNYGDLFISKLDINKKENLYTTYFGGSNEEGFHLGIKCLTDSIVYIGSYTASGNFYTSSDALYKNYCGGTADACMIKMTLPKSKVSSISQTLSFKEIEIFPNPTTGQFRVSFNKTMTPKAIVEIYNSKGNQIFLQTFYFTLNATIDLSDFSDGIYLVKVIIDNMVYHQKVFKK